MKEAVIQHVQHQPQLIWENRSNIKPLLLEVGFAKPYYKLWPSAIIDTTGPHTLGEDNTMECRYDRLICAHVLEDPTLNLDDLLTRCAQALRPDGWLVAVVPASFSLCRLGSGPFAAGRCFSAGRLAESLQNAGFQTPTLNRVQGTMVATCRRRLGGTPAVVSKPKLAPVLPRPAGVTNLLTAPNQL